MKKTLVIGASPKEDRYSYKATSMLQEHGHEVIPVGIKKGKIQNLDIIQGKPEYNNIHTVTLYVGPEKQNEYYDYILSLKPKRLIMNPGTENKELMDLAKKNNIEVLEACTLVMLSTSQY